MSRPTDGIESDLIDLTEVPLADLPDQDDATLAAGAQRLLRCVDEADANVSGYGGSGRRID